MISRRKFLGIAGGVAAGSAAGGGAAWAALLRDHVDAAIANTSGASGAVLATTSTTATGGASTTAASDRVLVIMQLGGGNDGLNTLVPDLGAYRDARPTLAPLKARWNSGQIAAFEGIGLKTQSRSHFKAMDTWWAGTDAGASTTGWLGRWLDATEGDTPNPLRSISLGTGSPALSGLRSVPTVVLDPAQFTLRLPRTTDAAAVTAAFLATAAPVAAAPWLAAAQASIPSTLDAIAVLQKVAAPSDSAADTATALLQSAAGIIELGIGTRVILVGMNGFDTHSDQLARQADLLTDLAQGITSFFDRLDTSGHANKVMVLTTSEFGRRVAENASGGLDHGSGGLQFVMGPAVKGKRVVGEPALDRLVDGDMPIGIDTRSMYAVGLDWLGGPTDELLGGHFDRYGLL
jgi:uncharacterized protein (DUF1501 family)